MLMKELTGVEALTMQGCICNADVPICTASLLQASKNAAYAIDWLTDHDLLCCQLALGMLMLSNTRQQHCCKEHPENGPGTILSYIQRADTTESCLRSSIAR